MAPMLPPRALPTSSRISAALLASPPHRSSITRSIMLSTNVTPQALMTWRSTGARKCGRVGSCARDAATTSAVFHARLRSMRGADVRHKTRAFEEFRDSTGQLVEVEHLLLLDRDHPRSRRFQRPRHGRSGVPALHRPGAPTLRRCSGRAFIAEPRSREVRSDDGGTPPHSIHPLRDVPAVGVLQRFGQPRFRERLVGHGPEESADCGRSHRCGGGRSGGVGPAVVLGVADRDARGPAVPEHPAADVRQPRGEVGDVVAGSAWRVVVSCPSRSSARAGSSDSSPYSTTRLAGPNISCRRIDGSLRTAAAVV